MNAAKILKSAVIVEIALIPVSIAVSYWAGSFLPKEVLTLEENQTNFFTSIITESDFINFGAIALIAYAFVLLGAWIASIIGLLKLKRWGSWLYLCTIFLGLPIYFTTGFDVTHPIEQVNFNICGMLTGIIIGLAFFSNAIPRKDSAQGGVSHC